MGALRQSLTEPSRKPPAVERLDKYGRDPGSTPERLRAQSDYAADTGYSPLYHAALADLPRLASGAVCYALVLVVNMLSLGREHKRNEPRHACTLPISALDLAELCRANVRDIQRQLSEMKDRGMIACKTIRVNGGVEYAISLLYSKWQGIEDYAVWKRRQVVEIDSVGDEAETEDEELTPISKDAIYLFKRPACVRPGRATRAAKVEVGVREFIVENHSPSIDLECTAVITSGRLVVSATLNKGESEAKGEGKGNAERHTRRLVPPNGGSRVPPPNAGSTKHPRADEIISVFDPLLERWGSPLLSFDSVALHKACVEAGKMPYDFLVHFVFKPNGRGSRRIAGPLTVAGIIQDARLHWEKRSKSEDSQRKSLIERYRAMVAHPDECDPERLEWAKEQLAELERKA